MHVLYTIYCMSHRHRLTGLDSTLVGVPVCQKGPTLYVHVLYTEVIAVEGKMGKVVKHTYIHVAIP